MYLRQGFKEGYCTLADFASEGGYNDYDDGPGWGGSGGYNDGPGWLSGRGGRGGGPGLKVRITVSHLHKCLMSSLLIL